MNERIKLRTATIGDADLLFEWRNDQQTREASHHTGEIRSKEHLAWLTDLLSDRHRKLFIAEEDGVPVGTVRADYADGVYELSWTVAPNARGRGIGKEMVATLAKQIVQPIRAEIKIGNQTSVRIAEFAGMKYAREENGILHYKRAALE